MPTEQRESINLSMDARIIRKLRKLARRKRWTNSAAVEVALMRFFVAVEEEEQKQGDPATLPQEATA